MIMAASSIRSRILLAALLPLLLAVLGVGGLLLTRHAQEIERNLVERSVSLARQVAMLAELPLATGSLSNAQAVADFMERTGGTVGLSLVDRNGVTVDNRGNIGATALRMLDAKPLSVQVEREAELISVVHPVVLFSTPSGGSAGAAEQRVGWVAIAVSRADALRSVARLWWTGAGILLVATLASLLLVRAATQSVARPLATLSQALSSVAKDDFSVQLPETGRGELRSLAVHFNRMTHALQTARRGLRDDVTRATEALAVRTREAESANNAKSRFLAAASHDLRQPAHALSLYVAALRHGLRQQSPEVQAALLPAVDGMQASSRSLDALLNAVLDISRFDAGVVSPDIQSVAMKPLFDEVLKVLGSSAREKALKLRGRTPDVSINTDPTLLRRIIDNLVSNAIRFSRSGGILVAVRPRKNHTLIQVWDQGLGIAPANLPLIFEEFYQIKRGDIGQGGMGLGLAIVARAVGLLGGEISVRSHVGRGTCFTLSLPGACQRARAITTEPIQSVASSKRRVLVLDDDALIRDSMRTLLLSMGLEPIVEATLAALLPAAKQFHTEIAAVLVDYRLQNGFTGIEAARSLQEALGDSVLVIIVTGDTSPDRLRSLRNSGFPVVHKPLNQEALLKALASQAARHETQR
jgi:two-component system, sensor histidine kinase